MDVRKIGEWIFKILLDLFILTVIALFIALAGILGSVLADDWTWFQRCGSLIVIVAATMLLHRPLLSASTARGFKSFTDGISDTFGPERVEKMMKDHDARNIEELSTSIIEPHVETALQVTDRQFGRRGLLIAGIGTLIWGWGDLIGRIPSPF